MTEGIKKVGNYRLIKKIGSGATSEVFEARKDGELDKFAVKMIKIKTMSKQQRDMIAKEVLIIKSIDHPNIVKLHESLQTSNNYYLIFEFCQKGDLQKHLKETAKDLLQLNYIKQIMGCIANAVSYLHERGIAHRDIKLANVLLKKDYTIKLADFGFAREMNNQEMLMRTYCGTPITMAPQILLGKPYDKKCDIWSLGVILFQLVYGKLPFPIGKGYNDFIEKVTNQKVIIPKSERVPDSLIELINGCLEKDRENRYSIDQFLNNAWMKQKNQEGETQTFSQLMRRSIKQKPESSLCSDKSDNSEQEGNQVDEGLHRQLATRVRDMIVQEMRAIINRHLSLRSEIVILIEGNKDLSDLLEYYDAVMIRQLREKWMKLRIKGVGDAYFELSKLTNLQFPTPVNPQESEPVQVSQVLLNFLRKESSKQVQLQDRKARYNIVIKFLDFIQNFDIELVFLFNNGHEGKIDLSILTKMIPLQKEESEEDVKCPLHRQLNHITIAVQIRQKQQKFREYANSLKVSCQKRLDAIQRQINGY